MKWAKPEFVFALTSKLLEGLKYISNFGKVLFKKVFHNINETTSQVLKHIFIGLGIGIPLLLVITALLMSADKVFEDIVLRLPRFLLQFGSWESIFRLALVLLFTLLFFGVLQVLRNQYESQSITILSNVKKIRWASVTALTILIMLNAVYVLFVVIQFNYFFGNGLQDGFTYASYARRGFFELLFVTLINWIILICCLKLVKDSRKSMKVILKIMYSVLILVSGVMLASAYQRLSLYEAAYGFTMDRILAHGFMIYLIVIFAYTLIRVWLEKLTLLHFYLIAGLSFYVLLNVINVEQVIVDKNIERFKDTGKIDIHYLNSLSYTGVEGLIELYELDPDYPELKDMLINRKQQIENQETQLWQSFNFTKHRITEQMKGLDIERE